MDIINFALKMEKDGETFYRELAGKCGNKGLAAVLEQLAEDEVKHYKAVENMRSHSKPVFPTSVLTDAKSVFEKEKISGAVPDLKGAQKDLYLHALDLEKKSEAFYRKTAGDVNFTSQKALLLQLAEEEKQHVFLLENILEFISRPETWLENAEFNHLEEY